MSQEPLVSIVFRSRNEGKSLISLLPLLFSQKTNFPFEVILQENSSTDQTSQIIQHYPQLKVVNIPYGQFHPSKTTMEGAEIARGEILVHLSAHCFPSSFSWLQNLVQPLINDPTIIATYGRQFADPNVNAYQELDYRQLFFPKTGEPKIKTFSNANGAIRKKYLLEHPFDKNVTSMGDHLWFLEIPDKSKIIYVPKAEVLHLHPLFNLKYYMARWQRGGRAMFYINKTKKLTSPLVDSKLSSALLTPRRILSSIKVSIILFSQGLFLYGFATPFFYFLRDWFWKKGLALGEKEFYGINPQAKLSQPDIMLGIPMISIIIRAKNEGKSLITLLPLLYAQKSAFSFEVLLFDNGSNDQTKEISQNYPELKYNYIPNNSFHFSKSLNDAAKIGHGEILVHLSAHCFPTSYFWLQELTQPLVNDSSLIATYGRQFTDANVNSYEKQDWEELLFPKDGQPKIPTFSNANGAIRKSYLLNHPFDETIPLLEDNLWYLEIPDKTKIVYVPQASLLHLHPLFNLKYYQPRWVKEGIAAVYIEKVKSLQSPLTSFNKINLLFNLKRVLSFFKMGLRMIKDGYVLYGLFAPVFFLIRDYSWRKGLKQGTEIFKVPPSQGGTF